MALGVAVTTGVGWPGAGPRGWPQARNRFARGPAASTFLKAWPGPGVQALPSDGGEGARGPAAALRCVQPQRDGQGPGTAAFGNAGPCPARQLRRPHHRP